MDRFKFRVPYRCFECGELYFDYLEWNGWSFTHIEANICCHKDAQSERLSEAEQCTGLKDKNGKLIFEGDRIKAVKLSPRPFSQLFFGKKLYDEIEEEIIVTYKDLGFNLIHIIHMIKDIEIIGTVHGKGG